MSRSQKNSFIELRNESISEEDKVELITKEIDCHCHNYQFWYGVLLAMYVLSFGSAVWIILGCLPEKETPSILIFIIYSILGLIIVIIYVLMEVETPVAHAILLYLYITSVVVITAYLDIKIISIEVEDVKKGWILFIIGSGSAVFQTTIIPKLKFRGNNLMRLEKERRDERERLKEWDSHF